METTSKTYSTEGRALITCKACKSTRVLDFVTETTVSAWNGRPVSDSRVLTADRRPYSMRGVLRAEWAVTRPCATDERHAVSVAIVRGTVNEAKPCGARCMGATGPNCECACGGDNHGAGHAA